jgi:hypothetical protein
MRTALFFISGACLLATCFILTKLFAAHYPNAATMAMVAFVALWLVITAFNMWVGVSKAGYSVAEEFPIFLMLFGIPTVVAVILKWKVL